MTNSRRTRLLIRLLLVLAAGLSALPAAAHCATAPCAGQTHAWVAPAWDGDEAGAEERCCDGRAATERCELQACDARPRHVGGSRGRLRIVPPDLSPSASPEASAFVPAASALRREAPLPVSPCSLPAFLKHRALLC